MYRRGANEVYNYSIPEKIMNNRHASSPEAYPQLRSPHGSHYDSYGYSMSYSYNQLQHPRDAGYYDPHTLNDLYYPRQRSDSDSSTYIENQMLNQGWSPTGFNDEMDRQYTDADSLHDSYRDGHLDRGATKNTVTNRHANTPIMSSDRYVFFHSHFKLVERLGPSPLCSVSGITNILVFTDTLSD